jgi:hypothetical protein
MGLGEGVTIELVIRLHLPTTVEFFTRGTFLIYNMSIVYINPSKALFFP